MHIEQVLSDVPRDQRCKCREADARKPDGASTPRKGWLKRLFG